MPFKFPKIFFFLILLFSHGFGAGIRCGTVKFFENSQKKLAKMNYNAATFRGTVKLKESKPFIIYYTTEGQHAVKSESYIDSLEKYLHQAYEHHKQILGMENIRGALRTYFYNQRVQNNLYPVEVMDLGVEDTDNCGVLGAVFSPPGNSATATQIAIENNFEYDVFCRGYGRPGEPMTDYPWHVALKLTIFHELYHSFQVAYTPITNNTLFWAEASATGVEEIALPEINDYILFFSRIFNMPGVSMDSLSNYQNPYQYYYGYASLYLFLYSKLGPKFDSAIWNYFSKNPYNKFSMHLARLADSLGYNPEDLFHEYAKGVFYSGARANSSSFWPDMHIWPTWKVNLTRRNPLPAGTFDFIRKTVDDVPIIDSVARITPLEDYSIWVLSRFLEKDFVPPQPAIELAAYPNPWNPRKNPVLRFNLPEKANEVEIRSSNGALLERIKREPGTSLDWQPKKAPAPGILYYRTLPYGKNKVLIVSY